MFTSFILNIGLLCNTTVDIAITGLNGITIQEKWKSGIAKAYKAIAVRYVTWGF